MDEKLLNVLIAAGSGAAGWLGKQIVDWRKEKREVQPQYPTKSIVVTQRPHEGFTWSFEPHHERGTVGRALRIGCSFYVTNIAAVPITLMSGQIKYPRAVGVVQVWSMDRARYTGSDIKPDERAAQVSEPGQHAILPNETMEASIGFRLPHFSLRPGQTIKTTLTVIDQYNNKHRLRGVSFKYRTGICDLVKTVDVTPGDSATNMWKLTRSWLKTEMVLTGEAKVLSKNPGNTLLIVGARLRNPNVIGDVHIQNPSGTDLGQYAVLPNKPAAVRYEIKLNKPIQNPGTPFVGDVALLDQYNNEYWLNATNFAYSDK